MKSSFCGILFKQIFRIPIKLMKKVEIYSGELSHRITFLVANAHSVKILQFNTYVSESFMAL